MVNCGRGLSGANPTTVIDVFDENSCRILDPAEIKFA
jgi:hypothetical protein